MLRVDPVRELEWLRRVRDLSHLLAAEQQVERLLPLILDAAVELTAAERGYLVRVELRPGRRPKVRVEVAHGFDQAALRGPEGEVSRTVVARVVERGAGLVTTEAGDRDLLDVTSLQDQRVLAVACVPLRLRGAVTGVLYLDHRARRAAFGPEDLPLLQTFADQAALALETAELRAAARAPTRAPASREATGRLVGASPVMADLHDQIGRAARATAPVLILGESGSGKELVAREVHQRSPRRDQPFVSENCAATAETLLESELFGHARGAFTGAVRARRGLFLEAGRGTLFLDEVGDMSPAMQAKLLRVLQEERVRPVGAERAVPIACRVLAATHRDLRAEIARGRFRADLYYRLDVLRLVVPPLRARPGDVPLLARGFAGELSASLTISDAALQRLTAYAWPGNVRELRNEVQRLVALGVTRARVVDLSPEVQGGRGVARADGALGGKTLGQVERAMVTAALEATGGNKSRAARQLGIPRTTLYHLIERYGL